MFEEISTSPWQLKCLQFNHGNDVLTTFFLLGDQCNGTRI